MDAASFVLNCIYIYHVYVKIVTPDRWVYIFCIKFVMHTGAVRSKSLHCAHLDIRHERTRTNAP